MNSLADLTSAPVRLRVARKDEQGQPTGEVVEYWIHPLTFADHGALQRWVDEQFPDPFEAAWMAIQRQRDKGQPFNVAQEQFLLKTAAELAIRPRHLIGTPEADALLMSTEGLKRIILEGIRKGDPSFDLAAADRLVRDLSQLDLLRAYAATQMDLIMSDPKVPPLDVTPPSRPTGSTASRRTRRAKASRNGGGPGTSS